MDSFESFEPEIRVEPLPKHLQHQSNEDTKPSAYHSRSYWAGIAAGAIVSLSVALPATIDSKSLHQSTRTNSTADHVYQLIHVFDPNNSHTYRAIASPSSHGTVNAQMLSVSELSGYQNTFESLLLSPTLLPVLAVLGAIGIIIYLTYLINRPLMMVKKLTNRQREQALRKSYPDMPPPFPNAWFRLCNDFDLNRPAETQSLKSGKFAPFVIDAFDHEFTVQRVVDESNASTISCVDETGREWEVCEVNRVVFIWHDCNQRASSWQIPAVRIKPDGGSETDASEWKFIGTSLHEIICHIQEIPENGADTAHLDYLHGDFIFDWVTDWVIGSHKAKHTWAASWTPQSHPNQHVSKITIDTAVSIFDWTIPGTLVKTSITQVGPGIVQLNFLIPGFGRALLQETITPIHANLQRATHVMWSEKHVPTPIVKMILSATLIQFERDFIVWNSKRWLRSPMAVKEDGPLLKYRRWMKQFFDEQGGQLKRDFDGQSTYILKSSYHA